MHRHKSLLNKYLDDAKAITGSDYKTAQRIGVTKSSVAMMRRQGSISPDVARKLAGIIGEHPIAIIAAGEIMRHPARIRGWAKWIKSQE